jgi:hypothetical protein
MSAQLKACLDIFIGRGGAARLRAAAFWIAVGLMAAGCAAIGNQKAIQNERMLAAAGFQVKFADTPEKLSRLKSMPQRWLTHHQRADGRIFYIYADAAYCKCLYVGTEKAYQRYQDLAIQMETSHDELEAAEISRETPVYMDWDLWGAWGPWW